MHIIYITLSGIEYGLLSPPPRTNGLKLRSCIIDHEVEHKEPIGFANHPHGMKKRALEYKYEPSSCTRPPPHHAVLLHLVIGCVSNAIMLFACRNAGYGDTHSIQFNPYFLFP